MEIRVPDIGDFTDVPVIEIHVGAGDEVALEDPLVTLESDKATMDVPAPFAGVVSQLRVRIGDRVSEGSVLLTLEMDGAVAPTAGSMLRNHVCRPYNCRRLRPSPTGPDRTTRRWWSSERASVATRPRSAPPTSG